VVLPGVSPRPTLGALVAVGAGPTEGAAAAGWPELVRNAKYSVGGTASTSAAAPAIRATRVRRCLGGGGGAVAGGCSTVGECDIAHTSGPQVAQKAAPRGRDGV